MRIKSLFLLLSLFLGLSSLLAQQKSNDLSWPAVTTECKPFTRWWWLGSTVDKANITWNLEELSKAGIGGVEITPIYGIKGMESKNISYLSKEWMNMLSHTILEAKRLGMNIDMATGTGWPFGGPNISPENAASKLILITYTAKEGEYFSKKIVPDDKKQAEVAKLEMFWGYSDKGEKKNFKALVKSDGTFNWMPGEGSWNLIAVFSGKTLQKVKRPAPGGEGLVLDHFSASALDSYLDRFNKAFTDSKSPFPKTFFNDSYEVYNADWSPVFLAEFQKRRGYNLEDKLPEFAGIGESEEIARIKSDYRETMSDILLENFTKRWTEWAHSKGATTRNQAHGSPGNLLDLYATVDIPECESFGTTQFDIPGLRRDTGYIRPGDADPMMLKFASSGAHIAGKKYVSSETFTWLGEHFRVSLSQCKPQLDEIFVSGINHVYFHGTPYSPKETAWPGWRFYASVNFSPTNRFWRDISAMNQYITRCQSFLQMGQPDNDFLLYFPVYDLWHDAKGTDMPFTIHGIDNWLHPKAFYKTGTKILEMGYNLDYISDRFIKALKVHDGKIVSSGNEYKALIIPLCRFMPVETMKAILDLARSGANVIFVEAPSEVPGWGNYKARDEEFQALIRSLALIPYQSKDKMADFGKGKIAMNTALEKAVGYLNIPKEGVSEQGIKFIRRKNNNGYHYFLANLQSKPLNGWVKLAVDGTSAVIFNPLDGKSGVAKLRKQNNSTEVYLQLSPGGSLILNVFSTRDVKGDQWVYTGQKGETIELSGTWSLKMIEGVPIIEKSFSLSKPESWTNLGDSNLLKFSGTGKYSIEFTLPATNAKDWLLDLGDVRESARVAVNGKDAGVLWSIPFQCRIGAYLKPGKNTLEIEVTNIDANRIADIDRRKVQWKIFNDINVVNVNYKPFDASDWLPMPSGLTGSVRIIPLN
jgi:hypothetical protein